MLSLVKDKVNVYETNPHSSHIFRWQKKKKERQTAAIITIRVKIKLREATIISVP